MKFSRTDKKRVLHIIHGFGVGGAETWLLSMVKYLSLNPSENFQFDFLITGGVAVVYDEEIKKYGCEIYYLEYSLRRFFVFRDRFRSILNQNSYIAVHDHQDFISGWHFLAGLGSLPDVRISHLHNPYNFVRNYITNPGRWISFKLGRLLMVSLASKITGTSDAVMDEYGYSSWPYKAKRILPAYCGFDTNKFKYRRESKKEICEQFNWSANECLIALFVGRIGMQDDKTQKNQKNPQFALQVAKDLVSKSDIWKFLFVGVKGEAGEHMESEIKNEQLDDKIKFTGIRNDIPTLMSASSAFIFPSLWEGLGMVAVEAQCNGLPVIMSENVPSEAIIFKELVTVKKISASSESWAKTIDEFSALHEDRSEYSQSMVSTQFSIQNSVKTLINIYTKN